MRPSLLAWTLPTLLIASTAAAQGASPRAEILRSRAQVREVAGEAVAKGLPEAFDFRLYALVWLDLPRDDDAVAKVVTLPADQPLWHSVGPALTLQLTRERSTLRVESVRGSPCSGGMRKPPEVMKACLDDVGQRTAEAKRVVPLFATPRAHLKRVRVSSRTLPPRP